MTPTAKYALTAVVVIGMTLGVVYLVLVLTDQNPFSADWLYCIFCELLFAILLCYLPSGEHALVACVCGREECFVSLLARRQGLGSMKLYCFWHYRSNRKEELVFFFGHSKCTLHELVSRGLPQMHTHTENTVIETRGMHTNYSAYRADRHHKTIMFACSATRVSWCHDAHLRV